MPSCKEVSEKASDYVDGPMGSFTRMSMGMHLLACKHCRRYLRQFRMAIGLVESLEQEAAPIDQEIDVLVDRLIKLHE